MLAVCRLPESRIQPCEAKRFSNAGAITHQAAAAAAPVEFKPLFQISERPPRMRCIRLLCTRSAYAQFSTGASAAQPSEAIWDEGKGRPLLGQTGAISNVRFGSKADMCSALGDVRFGVESGHVRRTRSCPVRAKSGLTQRSKKDRYSMTSSAAISKPGGTVKPSAFAVLRLTTVSNFVGVCTGRSAGFAPRRMRSTKDAPCRDKSTKSVP